jgi:hypothetical protein
MLRTLFQTASVQLSDIDAGSLSVFFDSKVCLRLCIPAIVAVGSRGETESLAIAWNLRLASSSIQPDMGPRYLGRIDQFLGVSAKTSKLPPLSLSYVRHGLGPGCPRQQPLRLARSNSRSGMGILSLIYGNKPVEGCFIPLSS